jgi:hypothetical protein
MSNENDGDKKGGIFLEVVKALSVFLSSVVIALAGALLTFQYNSSQLEISRNKELAELVPKLRAIDPNARLQAIISLSLYGKNAVRPLVSVWADTLDYITKLETLNSIVAIGDVATPQLLETYQNPYEVSSKREWAFLTLVMVKYSNSEKLIREALYNDDLDLNIVRVAALGAGFLKYKDMTQRLVEISRKYRDDAEHTQTIVNVTDALKSMGNKMAKDEIIDLLHCSNWQVRWQAVNSMRVLGTKEDIGRLSKIASEDENESIRKKASDVKKAIELRFGI